MHLLSVPPLSPHFLALVVPLFLPINVLLSCTPQTSPWTVWHIFLVSSYFLPCCSTGGKNTESAAGRRWCLLPRLSTAMLQAVHELSWVRSRGARVGQPHQVQPCEGEPHEGEPHEVKPHDLKPHEVHPASASQASGSQAPRSQLSRSQAPRSQAPRSQASRSQASRSQALANQADFPVRWTGQNRIVCCRATAKTSCLQTWIRSK